MNIILIIVICVVCAYLLYRLVDALAPEGYQQDGKFYYGKPRRK